MPGSKRSNAQRLKDSLEDDIINGRRSPGERLDPETLGAEFNDAQLMQREYAPARMQPGGLVCCVD